MRHARRLDPSLLINLFTHRVQIDVKVGKENCCDKEVRNRQRSWKVLCERFLQELGRTEGPLSSVFSQCQVHQFEAGTNRSMSFARHFPRNSEAFQGLSSLVGAVPASPIPAWSVESQQTHLLSGSCTTSVWRVTAAFHCL